MLVLHHTVICSTTFCRLCFRLAAVHSMSCTHELIPLIMDDCMSTFSN
jgi:hypothetical protein